MCWCWCERRLVLAGWTRASGHRRTAGVQAASGEEAASLPPWAQDVAYKDGHRRVGTPERLLPTRIQLSATTSDLISTTLQSSFLTSNPNNKMHSCTIILISVGIITMLMMLGSPVSAVPSPDCSPSFLLSAEPKYRQICLVLSQLKNWDVPDERDSFEPIDTGIKRKDVDHVFLRFGRPRM